MNKWIFTAIAIVLIVLIANRYMGTTGKSVKTVDQSVTATQLLDIFTNQPDRANKDFKGKVIRVTGKVAFTNHTATGRTMIILDAGSTTSYISCQFDEPFDFPEGLEITVTGLCTGVMSDVILIDCDIVPAGT